MQLLICASIWYLQTVSYQKNARSRHKYISIPGMLSRGMIWETIQGHYVGNMIYGDELCSLEYIYI